MTDAFRDAASSFFQSYTDAFERRDVSAIAEHFRFPLQVTSDSGEIGIVSIPSLEAWRPQLERLLATYARLDVRTARRLHLEATAITPDLGQASTRWALSDSAGNPIYEFNATYTLARYGGALKITAIAHDEQRHMREALARTRSTG